MNAGANKNERKLSGCGYADQPLRDTQQEVLAAREVSLLPLVEFLASGAGLTRRSANCSRASDAFDDQEEAVMSSLLRLMPVNSGAYQHEGKGVPSGDGDRHPKDSQEEVYTARVLISCSCVQQLKFLLGMQGVLQEEDS